MTTFTTEDRIKASKKTIGDLIIELHKIAREQPDMRTDIAIRNIANDLARIGNEQQEYINNLLAGDTTIGNDKGYELSTHEKQAEFAKKRNYDIGDCV
jgi:hypothetical protein